MQKTADAPVTEVLHRIHPDITTRLRISESTAKALVRDGKLRSVLIGRSRRVTESAVREFIAGLSESA